MTKGMTAVDFPRRWRDHRRMVRDRLALSQAIAEANTPGLRSELIALASLQLPNYSR